MKHFSTLPRIALVCLLVLTAGAAHAANSLDVNATAALNGTNFGLEVMMDGTSTLAFVEDQTPAAESVYRASFWLDPNSVPLNAFGRFAMGMGKRSDNANVFRFQLQRGANPGQYQVRLACQNNAGVWKFARKDGTGSKALPIGDNAVQVTIEGVFLNSNQGLCRMTASNTADVWSNDGYQAGSHDINKMRCGVANAAVINMTGTGSAYFDEFESFRTLAP